MESFLLGLFVGIVVALIGGGALYVFYLKAPLK
jgi:hypothetical protein